jgi:hypothetical protein
MLRTAGSVVLALWSVTTAMPSSPACASCHPREVQSYAHTRMATAMMPAIFSPFARNLPKEPLRESADGYAFEYRVTDEGISVTASRGTDHAQGLIKWVVGAGEAGQTPLIQTRRGIAQHRVSYFPQLRRYGITVGDDAGASPNADAALGRIWKTADLAKCLNCHATSVSSDLATFTPGIQCIRCHPGAEEHSRGRRTPLNPGKLSAAAQVAFCGDCHRSKAPASDAEVETVRFQPLRLMKSKCFASGQLSCTTCHDAHEDVRRNNVSYNQRCVACHPSQRHVPATEDNDCVQCHMPAVQLHPALRFTDHFIRVVHGHSG